MLVVQKFGGTSVGSISRIKASCKIVSNTVKSGKRAVVVVSAMAGETDRLINLFNEIAKGHEELYAEMDAVVSTGEQVCAGLFAAELNMLGVKARSFNGIQAGILTDSSFSKAKIKDILLTEVIKAMEEGVTPVITGFQGFDIETLRQTTLGRGGSDTSALAIAAKLEADKCEIYKDVDGILKGDPTLVHNPEKIKELSYNSMLEIASSGAKVLELRSVNFASKYKIQTEVLSSFVNNSGTFVHEEQVNEASKIENITFSLKDVLVRIKVPSTLFETLKKVEALNAIYQTLSFEVLENGGMLNLICQRQDAKKFRSGFDGVIYENVAKISIVGVFLQSDKVLEKALEKLNKMKVVPLLVVVSEIKIMFILEDFQSKEAYVALYDYFLKDNNGKL